MVFDDGGGGTPGQFSGPLLNVALGCVGHWGRSSARCPFAQKAVANMTSMSAVVDSFSAWRAACFRAADHSKEESCRRVVLFVDWQSGTLIRWVALGRYPSTIACCHWHVKVHALK